MAQSAVAPQRPPQVALSKAPIAAGPWTILCVLALGEYMILMDTTIVNIAIPDMAKALNATLDEIIWVITVYILTFSALLIPAGRLGDMLGPKRLFLAGMALFIAASVACGLAQNPGQIIAFRVVQAIGGATLTPQTLSIITSIFPPQKRGAAFGLWGGIAALAAAAGPSLGGLLTVAYSWRAIFFINLPIGIVAITSSYLVMPELKSHRKHHLDLGGVVFAVTGLFCLIFALTEGQTYAWGTISDFVAFKVGSLSAGLISIPTVLILSAVLLITFVLWERRQVEPLLPLSLFKDRNFTLGCSLAAIQVFNMTSLFLVLITYLQTVRNLTALQSGVAILPSALLSLIAGPLAGRFADRINGKYLVMGGLAIYACGILLIIKLTSLTTTGLVYAPAMALVGLGTGMMVAPMTAASMRNIQPAAAGAASGFMNSMRQVGGVLGFCVGGAILESRLGTEMVAQAQKLAAAANNPPLSLPAQRGFVDFYRHASTRLSLTAPTASIPKGTAADVVKEFSQIGLQVYDIAYINAYKVSLLAPIAAALIGIVLASAMQRVAPRQAGAPGTMPAAGGPPPQPAPLTFSPLTASQTVVVPVPPLERVDRAPDEAPLLSPYLSRTGTGAEKYAVGNSLLIGRDKANEVALSDPKASRRHAKVVTRDDRCFIRDLGSTNGTFVNGERLTGERELRDGDRISIGQAAFVFHDVAGAARPRLIQVAGKRQPYPLARREMVVGRDPRNDIVINDPLVSRRHAAVSIEAGRAILRDLHSLNGTRVNTEPVNGEWVLQNDDIVVFGGSAYVFRNTADDRDTHHTEPIGSGRT